MTRAHARPAGPRILLTHVPEMRRNYYGAEALAGLEALAPVVLHEGDTALAGDALVRAATGCQLLIADRNTPVPGDVLSALPELVAVLRVAVDIRNIDVAAASRHGILVTQASRSWIASVAEMTIGLMIDVARGLSRANVAYKAGRAPAVTMGVQLAGRTAGIIGLGPLGQRMAQLCQAFGMDVLVCDPYVTPRAPGLVRVGLPDLLDRADFVLVLAAATPETENLIGAAELARMRPSAFLVNVARGNLIDEAALARALDAGAIAGVAMDVGRAEDQMPSLVLAARPDVTATPHIGGLTRPAIEGQALETVRQAAEILAGRLPGGAVNGDSATRLARFQAPPAG